jgi:hypothetical protein
MTVNLSRNRKLNRHNVTRRRKRCRCGNASARVVLTKTGKSDWTCRGFAIFTKRIQRQIFTIESLRATTLRFSFSRSAISTTRGVVEKRSKPRAGAWAGDESGIERERERERKRDSLLIRTRHSLGTVVADHRRWRRCQCVLMVLRGCRQVLTHAKAPATSCSD